MKKSLIALAVLAASGASFAQVTITGNLAMGYLQTTNGTAGAAVKDASGFGVDTSEINFAATEDLGGGLKATAKMSLGGVDRSHEGATAPTPLAVGGRDASLTLSSSMGSMVLASARGADYLTAGTAGVGAYFNGFDGRLFGARSIRDTVSFNMPVGPVSVGLSFQESSITGLGIGNGIQGPASTVGQGRTAISAKYSGGPLVVDGAFLSYNNNNTTPAQKDATRLSGSYDLGVAKIGFGTEVATFNTFGRRADYLLGLSMPFGALTFGTQMAMRDQQESPAGTPAAPAAGITRGTGLVATYSLSKRTSLIGNYMSWDTLGANSSNLFAALLSHSF
jgi:predicted porin